MLRNHGRRRVARGYGGAVVPRDLQLERRDVDLPLIDDVGDGDLAGRRCDRSSTIAAAGHRRRRNRRRAMREETGRSHPPVDATTTGLPSIAAFFAPSAVGTRLREMRWVGLIQRHAAYRRAIMIAMVSSQRNNGRSPMMISEKDDAKWGGPSRGRIS